jgi:hypothetical protein
MRAASGWREVTCSRDYVAEGLAAGSKLSTLTNAALLECMAAGVDREKAISVLALTWRETAMRILTPRSGQAELDASCDCRTVVGMELVQGQFRQSLAADQEAIDFLTTSGFAIAGQNGLQPAGGLGNPNTDGSSTALFFEYVVTNRKAHLLDQFSIGPTQMHLFWSALMPVTPNTRPGQPDGQNRCGWPSTWEELWTLYISDSVPTLLDQVTYLDPPCTNGLPYPASPTGDPHSKSVAWLAKHTGNSNDAEKYWQGIGSNDPSRAYQNALFVCQQQAALIGY